jgi:hypothetical protein
MRNAFGSKAAPVTRDSVSKIRAATKDQQTFYPDSESTHLQACKVSVPLWRFHTTTQRNAPPHRTIDAMESTF